MKLYFAKGACSLAPHIVLEELGIKYEAVPVIAAEPRSLEHLKLNPLGSVPTLQMDDGQPLTEAAAILRYLGDQKPEMGLTPKAGTMERYRLDEALNFVSTEMHKGLGFFFHLPKMTSDPAVQEQLRSYQTGVLSKRLDALEKRLSKSPYMLGNNFTVADAYLFTTLSWAKGVKFDLGKWPTIQGYFAKLRERPSVQAAMKAEGLV